MKPLSIFYLLTFVCNFIQAKDMDSLMVIKLQSSELQEILNDVIKHEKRCDYYDPKIIYKINIQLVNDDYRLQIGTVGSNLVQIGNESGCFTYQGHFFIIAGLLPESLFAKTNHKKFIKYYKSKEGYDPETGEVILDLIEDDSFSYWNYLYKDRTFKLIEVLTYCK